MTVICQDPGEFVVVSVFTIRTHKRFAVCRKVRLGKYRRRGIDGLLIELSLDGCRISHSALPENFALEDTLVLRLEGTDPIPARVRWSREGTVGLIFAQPLHNTALESLVRLCRGVTEPVAAYGT